MIFLPGQDPFSTKSKQHAGLPRAAQGSVKNLITSYTVWFFALIMVSDRDAPILADAILTNLI
jgi:hypothetical protein